jgi:hypothetical protein
MTFGSTSISMTHNHGYCKKCEYQRKRLEAAELICAAVTPMFETSLSGRAMLEAWRALAETSGKNP